MKSSNKLNTKELSTIFSAGAYKDSRGVEGHWKCRKCLKVVKNTNEAVEHFNEGCVEDITKKKRKRYTKKVKIIQPSNNVHEDTQEDNLPQLTHDFFIYLARQLIILEDQTKLDESRISELSRELELIKQQTEFHKMEAQKFRTANSSEELDKVYEEYKSRN